MSLKTLKKEAERKLGKGIVFGEGSSKARIMIVGEAPGKNEIKTGKPFVGRSGKFLDKILKKNKLKRRKIYITSVLKTSPEKVTKREIEKQRLILQKQIKIIKPKLIVLLGNLALTTVLGLNPVTRYHGDVIKKEDMTYMPTFHPAAAMRFPEIRKQFIKDFKKISRIIR